MMRFDRQNKLAPLYILVGVFLVYFFSWLLVYKTGINLTVIQSEDTLPAFFLPASIIKEGNFNLDEYFDLLVSRYPQPDGGRVPFYLEEVGEHFYSAFPVIMSLLSVPVYFLPLKVGLPVNFETIGLLGHLSASLIVAASVAVMFLVFRRSAINYQLSTILSLIYAFGTCSFALSSQSMWQHGASQLMLSLALYFLVRGLKNPPWAVWAGLFLSLATLARPTGAIAVLLLSVYFLRKYRWGKFFKYVFLGLIPLGLFLMVPGAATGMLAGYASQVGSSWTAPFPGGFLGLWFSPSKGVLTYSPVFLFSFFSIFLVAKVLKGDGPFYTLWRQQKSEKSDRVWDHGEFAVSKGPEGVRPLWSLCLWVFACVMVHSLVVGKWYSWYGGWAFGYRMMTDMLPFLAFLWVPFVRSDYWARFKKWFYLAAIYSLGIQLMGIGFYDGVWHNLYDGGGDLDWLFSIKNCEMMYYLRRIIGKFTGVPATQIL